MQLAKIIDTLKPDVKFAFVDDAKRIGDLHDLLFGPYDVVADSKGICVPSWGATRGSNRKYILRWRQLQ